ncbi:MAG: hypothetical protein Q9M23_04165 [Mariprofundaceae bacterium]|nr:hypothetical protein [Mariprofundaceae bacterium]
MQKQAPDTPMKVIIIDQDNVFLHVITTMFQGLGWQVSGFTAPQEARQCIESELSMQSTQPSLLIAGFDPPGTATQKIIGHARKHFPTMRFLLLSSKPNVVPMSLPENTDLLRKPVRPRQLLSAAESLMAGTPADLNF